jgi:diacylglycerol diphosphate phosphatase / phosphatidate phosphatase
MAMAYFSYRRYYPSLRSVQCNEPYPSRAAMALLNGAGKSRDEEQNCADEANFALDDMSDDPAETDPLRSISRDGAANDSRDPG